MTLNPQDTPIDEGLWRTSSRSGGGAQCVQVAVVPGAVVGIRDSKRPDGGQVRVDPAAFAAFLQDLKDGRFDLT